jgi:hypothetical protein
VAAFALPLLPTLISNRRIPKVQSAHIAHLGHSSMLLSCFVKPQIAPIGMEAAGWGRKRGVTRNTCAKSGGGLSMLDRSFRKRWKAEVARYAIHGIDTSEWPGQPLYLRTSGTSLLTAFLAFLILPLNDGLFFRSNKQLV